MFCKDVFCFSASRLPFQKKYIIFYTMRVMKFFRPLDFVVLAVFLGVAAGAVVMLRAKSLGAPVLVVNTPDGEYVYPLDKNRVLHMKGLLGESVVVIQDKSAFFKESPCPNKVCVQSGAVRHNNDWAACLPNQVIIHVEADGEKDGLDAVLR